MVVSYSVNANMSADLAARFAALVKILNSSMLGNSFRLHVNIYSSRYNVSASTQCVLLIVKLFQVSSTLYCSNAVAFNSQSYPDSLRDILISINSAAKSTAYDLNNL